MTAPAAPALSTATTLRLGWRFLRVTDRRRGLSMALVVIGIATAVLSVLSGVAAFTVVHERSDRSLARAFQIAAPTEARPAGWVDVHPMPFGDTVLLRVDVATDAASAPASDVALPPGLSQWPAVGQEVVSPAFATRRAHDAALSAYAPGRVVGTVGEAGLLAPDELLVYRGVERSTLPGGGMGIVAREGTSRANLFLPSLEMPAAQVAGLVAVFATCVGLPLLTFFAVAARLSAATRARRLAALHVLGVPGAARRRVNACETVALALAGTVLALCLSTPLNAFLAGSGVIGVTWFAADTRLSPVLAGLVLLAVPVLAGVVASRTGRETTRQDAASSASVRTRRATPATASSAWRLLPLAVGAVSLVGQVAAGASRPAGQVGVAHLDLLMAGAVLLTAVGLLLGLTPLIARAGRLLHRRGRTLATRLGGARAALDPSATARLVAGAAVLVFALGVTIGQTRDARAVSTPVTPTVDISVDASTVPRDSLATLMHAPGVPSYLQVSGAPATTGAPPATVAVTTCASLLAITGGLSDGAGACQAGTAYFWPASPLRSQDPRSLPLGPLTPTLTSAEELPAAAQYTLPPADAVVTATSRQLDELATTITTSVPDSSIPAPTLTLRVANSDVQNTLAAIYTVAPYSQPSAMGLDPDSGRHIAMVNGYIRLGLVAGSLLALLTLCTALADRVGERRRADHELLAGGAPASLVRAAHRWEVLTATAVGVVTSAVLGTIGGLAWQYAGGLVRTPDWASTSALFVAAGLATGAAVIIAAALAPRALEPAVLRST